MSPRRLLVSFAALALVLTGCSADTAGEGHARPASAEPSIRVKIPVDRPLYGEREQGRTWRTGGLEPARVKARPYASGALLGGQLEQPVDDEGVRYYERLGKHYYHPVAIAQFALAKLDRANRTGSKKNLRSAIVNAEKLLDIADDVDGGLYFAYPFDFALGGRQRNTIHAPWWSAMAQGEALSLFVRLHEATGQQRWADVAHKTFRTLDDRGPRTRPWSVYVDKRGYLWFEEYAGDTKPLIVLNGHMFALFGLWDYHRMTRSEKAAQLFDAGATTLREYLPLFREPGDVSFYCLRMPLCEKASWQSEKYHAIHIAQLHFIADMTDHGWFRRMAERLERDFLYDGEI